MQTKPAAGSGIGWRPGWLRTVVGSLALLSLALPTAAAGAQAPGDPSGQRSSGSEPVAPRVRGVIRAAPPSPDAPSVAASPIAPDGSAFLESVGAPFSVTYDAGFDANPAAKAAFQAAVDVWATKIRSAVTIRVSATFSDLGFDPSGYFLGFGEASTFKINFPGAPLADTYYPIALANALAGTDLATSLPDVKVEFNDNPNVPWFFGLSGAVPFDKEDFATVVLHELGHGLGFLGSMDYGDAPGGGCGAADAGCYNSPPFVYDRLAETVAGTPLLSFASPSVALGIQLTTAHGIQLDGVDIRAAGGPALLSTPNPWEPGSSFNHVDSGYTGANAMMRMALPQGQAIHDPGPLVLGIFQEMGWRLNTASHAPADFDGNDTSDVSVFRTSGSTWYERTVSPAGVAWGTGGDIPVPGDYDGDGNADEAVFRPSTGVWYLRSTPTASVPWGAAGGGDIPVPADYDGDGVTDLAVFRPSTNVWYLRTATASSITFGASGDVPVPGDYDGDGKADIAVFRPSTKVWYVRTAIPQSVLWGAAGDIPVPGDYDGDGRADIAVFRPGTATWYLHTGVPGAIVWGGAGDVPVPGDYNGDGKIDVAVFRPSTQIWYLRTPMPSSPAWGALGDIPLALPFAVRRVYFP